MTMDVEKLLWVPGEKTIFIPTTSHLNIGEIVAAELARLVPMMQDAFEKDETFYRIMQRFNDRPRPLCVIEKPIEIPLGVRHGNNQGSSR